MTLTGTRPGMKCSKPSRGCLALPAARATLRRGTGKEYALVLPGTQEKDALAVAERLRAALEVNARLRRPVTASLGVASFTPDLKTPGDLNQCGGRRTLPVQGRWPKPGFIRPPVCASLPGMPRPAWSEKNTPTSLDCPPYRTAEHLAPKPIMFIMMFMGSAHETEYKGFFRTLGERPRPCLLDESTRFRYAASGRIRRRSRSNPARP